MKSNKSKKAYVMIEITTSKPVDVATLNLIADCFIRHTQDEALWLKEREYISEDTLLEAVQCLREDV